MIDCSHKTQQTADDLAIESARGDSVSSRHYLLPIQGSTGNQRFPPRLFFPSLTDNQHPSPRLLFPLPMHSATDSFLKLATTPSILSAADALGDGLILHEEPEIWQRFGEFRICRLQNTGFRFSGFKVGAWGSLQLLSGLSVRVWYSHNLGC